MSDPDYAAWLTKDQAAERIGVTTKTVERFVQAGQIQQARWQPLGRGPLRAVYCPEDVDRLARERQPGPLPPFLVPAAKDLPANGNGHGSTALAISPQPSDLPSSGDELLKALMTALVQSSMSQTSQTSTLFLTLQEASAVSGLSQAYLKRQIEAGTLKAIRDRGWRIRRTDLEAL
jgi:excisionase family DNA binding protein